MERRAFVTCVVLVLVLVLVLVASASTSPADRKGRFTRSTFFTRKNPFLLYLVPKV